MLEFAASLIAAIICSTYGGYLLDQRADTEPFLMILSVVINLIITIKYHAVRLRREAAQPPLADDANPVS